jgi:peptidoglycan/LPS O-acetylase OafA/YrhL
MLALVQGYRGLAACLVVLYHAAGAAQGYFGDSAPLHAFGFGWAGVQFFFVLSGFIILHIHRDDVGTPSRVVPYLKKRAIRIYPPYVLLTLLLAPAWLLVPSFGEPYHKDVWALALSILLVPQPHYPHLGVAWTLIHEVMFYFVFAVLILHRRMGLAALGIWFAAVIVANVFFTPLGFPATYMLSVNNLLFGFGMLVAMCKRDFGWPLFIAANAGFLIVGAFADGHSNALILAFGAFSAAILLCARRLDSHFSVRPWQALGDASYSIYLIHYPVISVVCKVLNSAGVRGTLAAFAIGVTAALIAGFAFHRFVEVPLLNYFRGQLRRESQVPFARERAR